MCGGGFSGKLSIKKFKEKLTNGMSNNDAIAQLKDISVTAKGWETAFKGTEFENLYHLTGLKSEEDVDLCVKRGFPVESLHIAEKRVLQYVIIKHPSLFHKHKERLSNYELLNILCRQQSFVGVIDPSDFEPWLFYMLVEDANPSLGHLITDEMFLKCDPWYQLRLLQHIPQYAKIIDKDTWAAFGWCNNNVMKRWLQQIESEWEHIPKSVLKFAGVID